VKPFFINMGLFQARLNDYPSSISPALNQIYGDCQPKEMSDFTVSLAPGSIVRKYLRPQIVFESNTQIPFKPLPFSQAYALLEWGLNWCLATHDFNHLLLHSAVLVKNNKAVLFPALPGSGKSTLSCWLAINGWKLYSDEMAVINTDSLTAEPLYRPACIKNRSIELVRGWQPDATITKVCSDTAKGDVAHAKFQTWTEYSCLQPVEIAGIVFPKYDGDLTEEQYYTIAKSQVFEELCQHAFNYHVLGYQAFDTVWRLIDKVKVFEVHYSNLDFMDEFLLDEVVGHGE